MALIDNDSKPPTCRILDAEPVRLRRAFPLPKPSLDPVWSPDGKTLATTAFDQKIDLWDAASGIRRATLEVPNAGGLGATFRPAGTLMASNGLDGQVRLWEPMLGRPW